MHTAPNLLNKIEPLKKEKRSLIVKEAARVAMRGIYPHVKLSEEMLDRIVDRMEKNAVFPRGEAYIAKKMQAILRLMRQKKVVPRAKEKIKNVASKVYKKVPDDLKELGRAMKAPRNTIADLPPVHPSVDLWDEYIKNKVSPVLKTTPLETPLSNFRKKQTIEDLLPTSTATVKKNSGRFNEITPKKMEDTLERLGKTPKSLLLPKENTSIPASPAATSGASKPKSKGFGKLDSKNFEGKHVSIDSNGRAVDLPKIPEVSSSEPINQGNLANVFSALGLSPTELLNSAASETGRINDNNQLRSSLARFFAK